jgi:hypothetical protein
MFRRSIKEKKDKGFGSDRRERVLQNARSPKSVRDKDKVIRAGDDKNGCIFEG